MERSLKDYDNEARLINEKKVIGEITLETIMESENVRIDEKFIIQERIVDYNSDDNVVTNPRNDEVCLKNNNDLQNEGEPRQEQSSETLLEPRVEIVTPTTGRNMIKNHPSK